MKTAENPASSYLWSKKLVLKRWSSPQKLWYMYIFFENEDLGFQNEKRINENTSKIQFCCEVTSLFLLALNRNFVLERCNKLWTCLFKLSVSLHKCSSGFPKHKGINQVINLSRVSAQKMGHQEHTQIHTFTSCWTPNRSKAASNSKPLPTLKKSNYCASMFTYVAHNKECLGHFLSEWTLH